MDISIIIPCFNREKTIERAIHSVINQTIFFENKLQFEIIVVDDGSNDASVKIVEDMKIKNLKVIKLPDNKGGNKARNIGIAESTGEFIAFQDSDDVWLPNKIETQLNKLKKEKADIVFSSLISNDNGIETTVPKGLDEGFTTVKDFLSFNKMSTQVIFGKSTCFKQENFDESISRFQDWEIALRLVTKYKVFFIKEPLAIQYIQTNSITRNNYKAYSSLLLIEEKHRIQFKMSEKDHAKIFESIAYFAAFIGEDVRKYLKKSLMMKFSFKVFIKYILIKIKLYHWFYKIK